MNKLDVRRACVLGALTLALCFTRGGTHGSDAAEARVPSADERFQSALLLEEGSRDYEAAIREYRAVIEELDVRRRMAAAAVYRLGECYRKLGRTNEAVAQFERVLREFGGDEALGRLSRQNLAGLGRGKGGGDPQPASEVDGPTLSTLEAALKAVESRKGDVEAQAKVVQGFFPDDGLQRMLLNLAKLRRQESALRANPTNVLTAFTVATRGDRAGDVLDMNTRFDLKKAEATVADQLGYIQDRVDFIVGIQRARYEALALAPKRTGNDTRIRPPDDEEELARIEGQIELVRRETDPTVAVKLLETFFGQASIGQIFDIRLSLRQAESDLRRAEVDFAESSPGVVAMRKRVKELKDEIPKEMARMLRVQEAKADLIRQRLGRDSAATASARGAAAGKSQASTSEEAEEIRRIESLVTNSPDLINALSSNGLAPLHNAASKGQLLVARYLLDHGARTDVRARDDGSQPLHRAVTAGHKAMVELLLDRGADIRAPAGNSANRSQPLHLAASYGFVAIAELLLARGADVNALLARWINLPPGTDWTVFSGTPLQAAVSRNRLEAARLLLAKGADPNRRIDGVMPPLTSTTSAEMVELLLKHGADPNADGGARLVTAAGNGQGDVARLLLDAGAKVDAYPAAAERSALFAAVEAGDRELADELIRRGADINRILPAKGCSAFHQVVAKRDPDLLRWGLDRKGDPNLRDADGRTPLERTSFLTAPLRRSDSRSPLPRPGQPAAGPSPSMRQGSTTDAAADAESPVPWQCARILLQRGAHPDDRMTFRGAAMAHVVAWFGGTNEWAWLAEAKADPNVGLVVDSGRSDPTWEPVAGTSPLMVAACRETPEMLEALIRAGAKVNATNASGLTALHYAVASLRTNMVAPLLAAGADLDAVDLQGRSPRQLIGGPPRSRLSDLGLLTLHGDGRPSGPPGAVALPFPPSRTPSADWEPMRKLIAPPGTPSTSAPPPSVTADTIPSVLQPQVVIFGSLQAVVPLTSGSKRTLTELLLSLPNGNRGTDNLRRVRLHRPPEGDAKEGSVREFDVEEILRSSDPARDPVLKPGDRIEVRPKLL